MSKSLVDTCIYETYWSIKLLPHANITDISTDIIDISTDIDTDIISVSLLNFIDIRYRDTDTDSNIGASLHTVISTQNSVHLRSYVHTSGVFTLHCVANYVYDDCNTNIAMQLCIKLSKTNEVCLSTK